MRFLSLRHAAESARRAAARFPLVVLSGAVAALAFVFLIEADDPEFWIRLLAPATLGLPLFTGLTLWLERRSRPPSRHAAALLAGVVGLAVFYVLWPDWSESVRAHRYAQMSVGLHLLAAFLPYADRGELNGFWQYNRSLLERFLVAGVYAVVLFLGLALALAGIDNLLGVDIDGETYARLWGLIAFVFNPWFFLAGLPTNLDALERDASYPDRLRNFMQYVLAPLVTVYLGILTVYLFKIILTREWPSGWIGYLVSSVTATGILSLLLVHPVAERQENRWIATYARWFYVALLPSIGMVCLAVWQRIAQYGVTERRYFLAVLALWAGAVAVYYAWTRSRNIKLIPISLCVVALVTLAGPWSAYAVSSRSQVGRLEEILRRHEILVDGAIRPAAGAVPLADRREISAVLRYLIGTHGTDDVASWFPDTLRTGPALASGSTASRGPTEARVRALVEHMGVAYEPRWSGYDGRWAGFTAQSDSLDVLSVTAFDYAVDARRLLTDTIQVEDWTVFAGQRGRSIRIARRADTLDLSLEAATAAALRRDGSRGAVVINAERPAVRARLVLSHASGQQREAGFEVQRLEGLLLLALR